ncbi:MAG: AMP-binding protein [Actinomycetota bacterium]
MNLAATVLRAAAATPDRRALLTAGGPVSHGELADRTAAAVELLAARVGPGDRVAIVAGNETEFVTAYLGTVALGAVAVPCNPASPSHELANQLHVVDPALVVASEQYGDLARRACAHAPGSTTMVWGDNAPGTRQGLAPVARAIDDLAVLLFTAGTAGAPKAAMLTHGSLLANLEQMQGHPGLRIHPDDVALGVLPWFHVYGLNVVLNLALAAGAAVSIAEHFHPAETLDQVRRDRVTVVAAVPAVYAAWAALDAAPADALRTVRLCVSGAAALGEHVARAIHDRFDVWVHDGYGLTEASPAVTTTAIDARPHLGSIGPPLPGVEVRIVDPDGNDVLEGDPGEVWLRGPNIFAGYWNDTDATSAVLTADGWLRTGDIAVAGADGWLTLVERVKDVVIVSGFNVFPGEVEDALAGHPDVAEVAVIGEPHPRTGETVVAYVVATEGHTPDPVALLRHAGRRLARYKLPTRIELVGELPRSFAGKVLRRELR